MSISFILWFLITCFFLIFWAWTTYMVVNQKRAWKFYAKKKDMRYRGNGFLEAPTINGAAGDYRISIFTSEHAELDPTSQRRLTAIELTMHTEFEFSGVVASGGMVKVIEPLDLRQEYKPMFKGWDDSYLIRMDSNDIMRAYLNDDRLSKLTGLMKIEKVWVLYIMMNGAAILRLDTPQPLDNPKRLDMIIQQMVAAANALELQKGESETALYKQAKTDNAQEKLQLDEELLSDEIGFELEDD